MVNFYLLTVLKERRRGKITIKDISQPLILESPGKILHGISAGSFPFDFEIPLAVHLDRFFSCLTLGRDYTTLYIYVCMNA